MTVTKIKLDKWIRHAVDYNFEFFISVFDTLSRSCYPVYFKNIEQLMTEINKYGKCSMQKINEVIRVVDGVAFKNYNVYEKSVR